MLFDAIDLLGAAVWLGCVAIGVAVPVRPRRGRHRADLPGIVLATAGVASCATVLAAVGRDHPAVWMVGPVVGGAAFGWRLLGRASRRLVVGSLVVAGSLGLVVDELARRALVDGSAYALLTRWLVASIVVLFVLAGVLRARHLASRRRPAFLVAGGATLGLAAYVLLGTPGLAPGPRPPVPEAAAAPPASADAETEAAAGSSGARQLPLPSASASPAGTGTTPDAPRRRSADSPASPSDPPSSEEPDAPGTPTDPEPDPQPTPEDPGSPPPVDEDAPDDDAPDGESPPEEPPPPPAGGGVTEPVRTVTETVVDTVRDVGEKADGAVEDVVDVVDDTAEGLLELP